MPEALRMLVITGMGVEAPGMVSLPMLEVSGETPALSYAESIYP
jgi:hypothetical protein